MVGMAQTTQSHLIEKELNIKEAYAIDKNFGIVTQNLPAGSKIRVALYGKKVYDLEDNGSQAFNNALIYGCEASTNSVDGAYIAESFTDDSSTWPTFTPLQTVYSQTNFPLVPAPPSRSSADYKNDLTKDALNYGLLSLINSQNTEETLPVYIQITYFGEATLNNIVAIKLPGFSLSAENIERDVIARNIEKHRVNVSLNGHPVDINKPITAIVGDVISFHVHYSNTHIPDIRNLPKTWIARFAGDLTYFIDPDHIPGGLTPWIGLDTQVHWLNVRHFEQEPGRKPRYPGFVEDGNESPQLRNNFVYHYTVAAPISPLKQEIDYRLEKFSQFYDGGGEGSDLHGDASLQRANQKEGLNMQILHYWNNDNQPWKDEKVYKNYSGVRYMMGFDDDEILYVDDSWYSDSFATKSAILKVPLRWQIVPDSKGGDSNTCINDMVNAYFIHKEGYHHWKLLWGHQIVERDYALSDWGVKKIPIEICFDKRFDCHDLTTIEIEATSPVGKFYSIEGPSQPARNELATYTMELNNETLFPYLDHKDIYTLTMEYETQDSAGSLKIGCEGSDWVSVSGDRTGNCTHQVYSSDKGKDKNAIGSNPFHSASSDEQLKFKFKTYPDAYCSVSLYVTNKISGEKVLLAGKQVKPIALAFMEDQKLIDGSGEGGYFFVEQQRHVEVRPENSQSFIDGPFNDKRGDYFVNPFVRTYVFSNGSESKSIWKVWDSDPHQFGGATGREQDRDWYQSNKRLHNRIFDDEINRLGLVKYYFDIINKGSDKNNDGYLDDTELGTAVCATREYEIDYSGKAKGTYQLTASYRGGPPIRHKIIIKDEEQVEFPNFASIGAYELSVYDKSLLKSAGMLLFDDHDYMVLEVKDVESKFKYHIGQRNNYKNSSTPFITNNVDPSYEGKLKKVNRWGPYLDYEGKYYWKLYRSSEYLDLDIEPFENAPHGNLVFYDWRNEWNLYVPGQLPGQENADYGIYDGQEVRAPKFPTLWGNHFSSLWKEEGPAGHPGPAYFTSTNRLKNDVNDHATYIQTAFNKLTLAKDPHYWQLRATLNSWSDSYGYRMRYNPSHIYDLNKVFDDTYGAFTGNAVSSQYNHVTGPKNIGKTKTRQPYPSDNFMNLQAWYYDLKMGRKIIMRMSHFNHMGGLNAEGLNIYSDFNKENDLIIDIQGYVENYNLWKGEISVPAGAGVTDLNPHVIGVCQNCTIEYTGSTSTAKRNKVKAEHINKEVTLPKARVYPVPSNNLVNIEITATDLSPLYIAVHNLEGKRVYEYNGHVEAGVNTLNFNNEVLGLSKGLYILKITTQEITEDLKLILK
ncbi:hypothetical protein GCM10022396_30560 [Flavivirga amylovorans]